MPLPISAVHVCILTRTEANLEASSLYQKNQAWTSVFIAGAVIVLFAKSTGNLKTVDWTPQ